MLNNAPNGVDALAEALGEMAAGRVFTNPTQLAHYAQSEAYHRLPAPDMVVRPESVAEVQSVVRRCAEFQVPITPYGAGTSLEGNAACVKGGVCLDLSAMNRILDVRPEDLLCVVEPGVTREQLNMELRATGLFFPIDPGANATLGGMLSTRASGTNAVRYGTMRENVLELKVVDSRGELVKVGTTARKSAAGYDLAHLFVGSEGTLGVIVEAALRLHGQPEAVLSATIGFESLDAAVQAVILTIQFGIPVARIELLDMLAIKACNSYSRLNLPEQPTLFLELHGSPASVQEQAQQFRQIADELGGSAMRQAIETEERNHLWAARHAALPAAKALVPGAEVWISDVCVPISRLAEAIGRVHEDIAAAELIAPIVGHVGDGNFHVFFVLDPARPEQWEKASRINDRMIEHALSVGGTCTGEHGIGVGKRDYMLREAGSPALAMMAQIKRALDPQGIFNPGKIFLD